MNTNNRALNLINRFKSEADVEAHWTDDPELFISWLEILRAKTRPSTFANYRKWLASYAREMGYYGFEADIRSVSTKAPIDQPQKNGQPDEKNSNKYISSTITQEDMATMAAVLVSERGQRQRYKDGVIAFAWLQATLMVGIRPSEWFSAVLLTDVLSPTGEIYPWVLEVVSSKKGNYKITDGETSQDERRRLVLHEWPREQVELIRLFISQVPVLKVAFKKQYEAIRQTLLKASGVAGLGDKAIGLYTGRHIFTSEVRRENKCSRYELAAMLGHADTRNQSFYGDKDKERVREFTFALPKPWPGLPEKVEKVDRSRYLFIYGSEAIVEKMILTGEIDLGM
jgi:hypothetical protein